MAGTFNRRDRVRDLDDEARTGTVTDVTYSDDGYVSVRWDGERRAEPIHTDNLEKVR